MCSGAQRWTDAGCVRLNRQQEAANLATFLHTNRASSVMLSGVDKVTRVANTSSEGSQQEYCYRYQSELLARYFHARNKPTNEFVETITG